MPVISAAEEAVRCVGAVIRDPDNRLLLVQRANEPGKGLWSIPGGKVEAGETDAEAVRREIAEETALLVSVGPLCGMVTRSAPQGTFEIYDYLCEVLDGEAVAGDDAAAVHWVDAGEFAALDTAGLLVDQLAAILRGWGVAPG